MIRHFTFFLAVVCFIPSGFSGTKVTINQDKVLLIDGKKVFPIAFTMAPKPGTKAPNGNDGLKELHDAGGLFIRTGPNEPDDWNEKYMATEQKWMDAAAAAGMYCLPWLKDLSMISPEDADPATASKPGKVNKIELLKKVVERFKDHPAMGCWKGADEPEWGQLYPEDMKRTRDLVRQLDPDHPMWIVQAPMGTVDSMREYNDTMDITGQDIYPISYPMGNHSKLPDRRITLVGDHTRLMQEVTFGEKPLWMTLQIAWSGVAKPERTLIMPTLFQERFMAYEAIINGSRGLVYFGGNLVPAMNEADKKLGWNWTWFNENLRPLLAEIDRNSPLAPALVARESEIAIRCNIHDVRSGGEKDIEFCVREVGDEIYLLACNRGEESAHVDFVSIPPVDSNVEVMFEAMRKVQCEKGGFTDWFEPLGVHVYHFHRKPPVGD